MDPLRVEWVESVVISIDDELVAVQTGVYLKVDRPDATVRIEYHFGRRP